MRFVSDIAAGLACFSAALAVLVYRRRRASLLEDARRAAWFAIAGLTAFGLSRFLDAFSIYAPDATLIEGLEIASTGVALTLSLACWGLIPGLIARPSAGELMAANARLEKAVAERTRALDDANRRRQWTHTPPNQALDCVRDARLMHDGEIVGLPMTAIDSAEHRRRQDELAFLLSELTHRTKNLLAVIQGIARQSSRSATDVQGFVHRFNGRLRALALTHELLVETEWRGVELRSLLSAVWRIACPSGGQGVVLRGPAYVLCPECAQNIALAVHEMAANAVSNLNAHAAPDIVISWSAVAADGFAGIELLWRENGARERLAPEPEFGLALVEDLLPRAVDGRSRIAYDETGLLWTLRIDDKQLRFLQ